MIRHKVKEHFICKLTINKRKIKLNLKKQNETFSVCYNLF